MDFREVLQGVKDNLSTDMIKSKIERDLGLTEVCGKYVCWLHNDNAKNPNMSYDKERGRFYCFRCGGSYDLFEHYQSHYGLSFIDATKKIADDFNMGITYEAEKPKKTPKQVERKVGKALEYIHKRGISDKTLNRCGVAYDDKSVHFLYYNLNGTHEATKSRAGRKFEKGEKKSFYWDGETKALYNMHNADTEKPLVIVEGEFDCLALIEAGYSNTVSLKDGAGSKGWIEAHYDWLQSFKEITLWFDNDEAGIKAMNSASKRLDNCTKVVYTQNANDINEVLLRHGACEVLRQLKNAKLLDVEQTITPKQIEDFNVYEAEKVKTGITILDKTITGLVMGCLNIITGYNGSGKSTLINQICVAEAIEQGFKTFIFSGELTHSNLKYWLYSTLVNECDIEECQTTDGVAYHKVSQLAKEKIGDWLDDKLYIYDSDDYSQSSILSVMRKLIKRKGVKVFVLDNLMTIDLENNRNELQAQKEFVKELKKIAKEFDVLIHLVAHPRKPQEAGQKLNKFDVAGSGDITNLADYVLGIHRTTKDDLERYEEELAKAEKENREPKLHHPKDASITLFKDRPTGTGDVEATLWFSKKRKRFYLCDTDLFKCYSYDLEEQERLPF